MIRSLFGFAECESNRVAEFTAMERPPLWPFSIVNSQSAGGHECVNITEIIVRRYFYQVRSLRRGALEAET
jgi:hypothetical protein